MKIQIKHRFSGNVLFELEKGNNTIKLTLEAGVSANANLRDACLESAYLRNAYLRDTCLRGASLEEIKTPPINDHQFASEILWRAAKTEAQKDFAARIRLETNQCWSFFPS